MDDRIELLQQLELLLMLSSCCSCASCPFDFLEAKEADKTGHTETRRFVVVPVTASSSRKEQRKREETAAPRRFLFPVLCVMPIPVLVCYCCCCPVLASGYSCCIAVTECINRIHYEMT